ncbi:caspase family protein [Pseudorhodoplanes sp.]|uniref:caspase family protein n=1 Tax=Pseudorhodoplanes sp. TaxID=1934341 RepID=UPI003D116B31
MIASAEVNAQNRVALVIGNDRYPNLPADRQLQKAVNDARSMSGALQQLGFNVIRGENLSRGQIVDHIVRFTRAIKPGDIALVFFAGHGVSLSGANYLLPADIPLPSQGEEIRVRNMALGESDLVADIQAAKPRVLIMVLDACRDNPFRQAGLTRSVGNQAGLSRSREAEGVFTIYSAGFGQAALDRLGDGDRSSNSVFTRVLIPALARSDAHLADIVIDLREEVARLAATVGHEQYPAYYDQTRGGRIYLRPPGAQPAPRAPQIAVAPPVAPAPVRQQPVPVAAPVPAGPGPVQGGVPRAVQVARATELPRCNLFVDASASGRGNGSLQNPYRAIGDAVAAANAGVVICVAEGTYREEIKPGEKHLTFAGGFERGFGARDSATYVTRAVGNGRGSFIRYEDPAPKGNARTVIDGFDISGYSQAIVREHYESQRFDVSNNHIHDNRCTDNKLAGGGLSLNNITGRIENNVFRNNSCGRGGAIFTNDDVKENTVTIEGNWIDNNHGVEPETSHGGAVYLFGTTLRITGNLFTRNSVTKWGGGLFVGADLGSGQKTDARLNWNVYRGNSAGIAGGGFFCDEGAMCRSYHEVYDGNCGGNIYLDSGSGGGPTVARFDHLTSINARAVGCRGPGPGVRIDRGGNDPDNYAFINAIFWGNKPNEDIAANCDENCNNVRIIISHSMVQTRYGANGLRVTFGDGIIPPVDPMFADPDNGDYHLKSAVGRWTPKGYVRDAASSPLLGRGEGKPTEAPPRAGDRNELGAYGNSAESSLVR